jgi:hypothetical protein
VDRPLVFLVPPPAKPLPVIITRNPLPTLNELDLPGFLRKADTKTPTGKYDPAFTPMIAKVTKSPGPNMPTTIVEIPTEVYLSMPGKLPGELMLAPTVEQPARAEEPAAETATLLPSSVDEFLHPQQRKLPAAVVQAPLQSGTDQLSTDNEVLPIGNDVVPTKRNTSDLLPVTVSPTAPAPNATANTVPQILLQPTQPSARNKDLGPG